MQQEAKLAKNVHKALLCSVKFLPLAIALCCMASTLLSCFGIECRALTYLAGIGLLPLLFILLASFAFKFCALHRLPIYYVLLNNLLCVADYEFGIPASCKTMAGLTVLTAAAFVLLAIGEFLWER